MTDNNTEEPESIESIEAELRAEFDAVDGIEPEGVEVEAQEEVAEVEAAEEEAEPEVDDEPEAAEEEEVKEPKKLSRGEQRVKDSVDRANKATAERDVALQREADLRAELDKANALIADKLTEKEPDKEFQPIDQEAHDKHQAGLDEIRGEIKADKEQAQLDSFSSAVKKVATEGAEKYDNWDVVQEAILNEATLGVLASGKASTEPEAKQMAMDEISADMYRLHQQGKPIGEYLDGKARHIIEKYPAKKKASSKAIDMVELNNLRDSAGAATNKTAASTGTDGTWDAIMLEARKEVERESMS